MIKKKILITGGTGFIGYHLALKCLKKNFLVTSLSTKKPKKIRKIKKVKYLFCDISKKKKLFKLLNSNPNFDFVVNLAGYVDHSKKRKTIQSHYKGCKNLALFFLLSKIKKFIQIGSSIEYGKINSPQKENNKNLQKTYSVYGSSKLLSTKYLINLKKKFNFPATILRLYLVYGPKQDTNRVIPITIINALKNYNFNCSDGLQYRDLLYIDDLINAIIKSLYNKKTDGEIVNIGSGRPVRIKNLILKICKLIKSGKLQFGKIKFRKDEIKKLYPDIKKIKKEINWKPNISFDKGIKLTIKSYKDSLYKI